MAFDWQVLWNQVLALALNLQMLVSSLLDKGFRILKESELEFQKILKRDPA